MHNIYSKHRHVHIKIWQALSENKLTLEETILNTQIPVDISL